MISLRWNFGRPVPGAHGRDATPAARFTWAEAAHSLQAAVREHGNIMKGTKVLKDRYSVDQRKNATPRIRFSDFRSVYQLLREHGADAPRGGTAAGSRSGPLGARVP